MITFLWPFMALALPVPFILRRVLPARSPNANGAVRVPFFNRLSGAGDQGAPTRRAPAVLLWTIWVLLILALMRPAYVGAPEPLPQEGRDIMMAMDLSGSMAREDFLADGRPADRLTVVKAAASDFIDRREGDRLGLVLFSDRAYLQAPLTQDRQVVSDLLDEAQVGLTGTETAIGDAIMISLKRLRDAPEGERVLLLLTDGANNAGVTEPLRAAELAQEMGVRIYTIGVAAQNQVVNTAFGRQVVANTEIDEATLSQISEMTGGAFFRATDAAGLAEIYQAIDRIEPVSGDPAYLSPTVSLFHWPLAAAFILALSAGLSRLRLPNFRDKSQKVTS